MPNSVRALKREYPEAKVHRLANNTYGVIEDDATHVILHGTRVVTRMASDGREVWRTGGWFSHTTKDRINRFAANGHVYQKDYQWYIVTKKGTYRFAFNSMVVTQEGEVYNLGCVFPELKVKEA